MFLRFKGKPFEFDYLLYICKSYKMDMSVVKKKKKKRNQTEESQDLMFINAEDELLCQVGRNTFVVAEIYKVNFVCTGCAI